MDRHTKFVWRIGWGALLVLLGVSASDHVWQFNAGGPDAMRHLMVAGGLLFVAVIIIVIDASFALTKAPES